MVNLGEKINRLTCKFNDEELESEYREWPSE